MYLDLLSENWDEIVKKVIEPLWNRKFKDSYLSSKLDKNDFMSLAGEELTKAFLLYYDPKKSNVFTYATNVLTRKAKSEIRNTRREKRLADLYAESIHQPIDGESGRTIEDMIEDINDTDKDIVEVDLALKEIYAILKPKESKVVELSFNGLSNTEIADKLKVETKSVCDIKKRIADRSDINRILNMHNIRRV